MLIVTKKMIRAEIVCSDQMKIVVTTSKQRSIAIETVEKSRAEIQVK